MNTPDTAWVRGYGYGVISGSLKGNDIEMKKELVNDHFIESFSEEDNLKFKDERSRISSGFVTHCNFLI